MNMLHRAFSTDLQIGVEGRTITGIAVPYNSPTMIAERGMVFEEQFAPDAFAESLAKRGDRVPILLMHDSRSLPIGKPSDYQSRTDGLVFAAPISDTRDGNDALTLARDGVLSGVSVGFSVPDGGDIWSADMSQRTIVRAQLHEISLVNFPAYDDARILAVREASVLGDEKRFQGTFCEITEAVETAIEAMLGIDDWTSDVWVCDISNTWAVYRVFGMMAAEDSTYWRVTYTVDNQGVATITSQPEAVEPAYVPVAETPARFAKFTTEQRGTVEMLQTLWAHKL